MMALMNFNPWLRLHAIVESRIDHLGETRDHLHAIGGPSSEWIRGLKEREGKVSVRQVRKMRELDAALGWKQDTARSLIDGDRSTWTAESLDVEAFELATTNLPEPVPAPETEVRLSKSEIEIRTIQTQVGAALRAMSPAARRDAMREIVRILGVS